MADVIVKKAPENITKKHKYDIIDDYVFSTMSNTEIANKYGTSANNVGLIISRHYTALVNARETKLLIGDGSTNNPYFANLKIELLNPEAVNSEFLKLLSKDNDAVLTDNEVIFCELCNNNGDEVDALEVSGLAVGIKKAREDKYDPAYKASIVRRCYFLKRKPNLAAYFNTIQKEKLKKITDGKGFIQTELLQVIEKLRTSNNPTSSSTYLKAVEALARTYGAFDDKMTVETINGDSAIDRILAKARQAQVIPIDAEAEGLLDE